MAVKCYIETGPFTCMASTKKIGSLNSLNDLYRTEKPSRRPKVIKLLAERLFKLGGTNVGFRFSDVEDYKLIYEFGRSFDELKVKLLKRERGECHRNCLKIWKQYPRHYVMVTGFARSNGGWIYHSWLLDSNGIVDTISKSKNYYGVIYTDQATQEWYDLEFPSKKKKKKRLNSPPSNISDKLT